MDKKNPNFDNIFDIQILTNTQLHKKTEGKESRWEMTDRFRVQGEETEATNF